MTLRRVGLDELPRAGAPWEGADEACAYLEAAPVLARSPQVAGGEALALQTDGTWVWPSDLADRIRRAHATLPEELVAHMRANGYRVPAVDVDAIDPMDAGLVPVEDGLP